jgi:hypothetical protein
MTHPASPTRQDVVGEYVYKSEDPEGKPTDHEFDHLTLRADGKYVLVQGGPTKPRSEAAGRWLFWGSEIELDHSGFPIQVKGSEVRLLIDTDLGIWYAKVK